MHRHLAVAFLDAPNNLTVAFSNGADWRGCLYRDCQAALSRRRMREKLALLRAFPPNASEWPTRASSAAKGSNDNTCPPPRRTSPKRTRMARRNSTTDDDGVEAMAAPLKCPQWVARTSGDIRRRKTRTLKSVLEQSRALFVLPPAQSGKAASGGTDRPPLEAPFAADYRQFNCKAAPLWPAHQQLCRRRPHTATNAIDTSIQAPPTVRPPKKYCDVTGLIVRRGGAPITPPAIARDAALLTLPSPPP